MNPLMLILVVRLMTVGPIADYRWLEITGNLLADAELRLPEPRQGTGTRAWLRYAEGEGSLSLQTSLDPSFSLLDARCRVRIDQALTGDRPFSSSSLEIEAGRWKLLFGPLRGGMGGGLLVRANTLDYRGAGARSAWSGVPTGLRSGPVSASSNTPVSIALQRDDGRGVSLAILRERKKEREEEAESFVALGVLDREGRGGVLLASAGTAAVEIVMGRRRGKVSWRLGAAGWSSRSGEGGASLEAVMTSIGNVIRWEMRLWMWDGSVPPMASPVSGATRKKREGLRFAATMHPPGPIRGDLSVTAAGEPGSVTAAGTPGQVAGPFWWREQLEVSRKSIRRAGWLLRLRRTTDLERLSWEPDKVTERRLAVLRIWSGSGKKSSVSGELRAESENSDPRSIGWWLQATFRSKGWNGYLRGTYSQPQPGIPLYWFDPGPAWIWAFPPEQRDFIFKSRSNPVQRLIFW